MKILGFNWSDLRLLRHLVEMSLRDRYLATGLGGAWAVLNPLLMFALYTFVFAFVLKVRVPGNDSVLGYVVWLIVGYGPWLATVEGISIAASSVISGVGLVKNLAFKTELLPLAAVLVGGVPLLVSIVFAIVLLAFEGRLPPHQVVLLPVLAALQLLLVAGIGVWLSAIAVFVRDLLQVIPSALTAMLFLSPVFYDIQSMPQVIQAATRFNPIFILSDAYRNCLIRGGWPDLVGLLLVAVLGAAALASGLAAFRRCKGRFIGAV